MQKKLHRAWIILIAMILIQAGIIGILMNCTGILFAAVLSDTGFRAGDLSVYYTIRSLVSAATVNIACRLFFQKNARVVMAVLGGFIVYRSALCAASVSFGSGMFPQSLRGLAQALSRWLFPLCSTTGSMRKTVL